MKPSETDYPSDLKSIQQQLEAWRAGKTGREPIPDYLWAAAVRLCRDHPITRVSRELRLSFNDLKKRMPEATAVRFTELECRPITGPWQIECQRSDGNRLRVSGSGPLPDLAGLLQDFLR
jgi:hypothetical protein